MECITSVPPSLELVPLIRGINPYFYYEVDLRPSTLRDDLQAVITWLEPLNLMIRQFNLHQQIISVLPTIISEGEEAKPHTTAFMISILALSFNFFPGSAARVSGHLACGCFRLMSNPPKGWDLWELPYELCSCWGKLAHPDTPTELITQWQSYLEQSLSLYPDKDEDVSATKFEAEWQEKQKHTVDFNATSQSLPYKPLDGAEVVHCFEQIMETLYRDSEEEGSVEGSEEESESD
ncbi:hypothetical protein B0H16DRAFT_1759056 [Mycena metata]|uniref:Uncharacterized protein n=1 Tax=Mycena metata TaxID=1033252 RepID=A0AAD7MYX6_9AGAR|nr:hypothetical protein B0H16DRAFT_1759056 [Mycena metata]